MTSEVVPAWVPEVSPGVRADVYPVEPPSYSDNPYFLHPPELRLDRSAVVNGYSERRVPYEFFSRLPTERPPPLSSSPPEHLLPSLTSADVAKLKLGLIALRRARPSKLQRVEAPNPPEQSRHSARAFPLQKMVSSQALDDWFNRLSNGADHPLSNLSRSVPLGPAIVRAAGKVIEMMAIRAIPTQRAAWYIRIAVLNECVKQIRPDRPPPSPKLFWTKQLCNLLKAEIHAIRARKTAILGSMERVAFWQYVLDLARWQADEGLLDVSRWIVTIATDLHDELASAQNFSAPGTKITLMAARYFLPEFLASPDTTRVLVDALLPGASCIIKTARATAAAAAAAANRESAKSKSNPRKPSKRATAVFAPNPCHFEVMYLLDACIKALQIPSPCTTTGFRMNEFALLFRKAWETRSSKDRKKDKEPKPDYRSKDEKMFSPNKAMRHFEMLSTHGDVARTSICLKAVYSERGGRSMAVRKMCEWALSSLVADRAEAICVASAILRHLATESTATVGAVGKTSKSATVPKRSRKGIHQARVATAASMQNTTNQLQLQLLQRDIWHFIRDYAQGKIAGNSDKEESTAKEEAEPRRPESVDENDSIVRFIANLCRHDLLSLPSFVREISRLSATNHSGAPFLIKCLSLLPDPVDKSIADCRRSILRKHGYLSGTKTPYPHGICEKSIEIACSGDIIAAEAQIDHLSAHGGTNVILTTIDALCHKDLISLTGDVGELHKKLSTMASFMVSLGEAGTAVEWILDSLDFLVDSGNELESNATSSMRRERTLNFIRLVTDLSRYVAAGGYLEHVFLLMKKLWGRSWCDQSLRKQILRTLSSFARYFGFRLILGKSYWTKLVWRHFHQLGDSATASVFAPIAQASLRGLEEAPQVGGPSIPELLNGDKVNWGVLPDDDISQLAARTDVNGISISELRKKFTISQDNFAVDEYFVMGFTANEVFGSVLIPVLKDALLGSANEEHGSKSISFSRVSSTALHLISSRRNDVRFQGIRPAILLEFVTLLFSGCYHGLTESSESLDVLFGIKWVWKVLAPYSSIALAQRLRIRANFYSRKKGQLSVLLFNLVSRLCGRETGGEEMVLKGIGSTPFGEVEMLVALLAQHRRESGEEDEFGLRVSRQATLMLCKHSARTLVSVALQCYPEEGSKQFVAGHVGHAAALGMNESLTYVLAGLTVEASKNNDLHRERSQQWHQADEARRALLETAMGSLKPEHAVDIENALFEQLGAATKQISEAMGEGRMPGSTLEDGRRISEALESRFLCILRSPRIQEPADSWRQRAQQIGELLKCAVGLMTASAIVAACNLLDLCLRGIRDAGKAEDSKTIAVSQVLEWPANKELKQQLEEALIPAMPWVEQPERDMMAKLIPRRTGYGTGCSAPVRVFRGDGRVVDNWILLEGYGRGADEESAISADDMWRQGENAPQKDRAVGTVHLKRTYSTFASLAV